MLSPAAPLPPEDAAVQANLRRMAASLAVAIGLAQSGRAIDLTGLDSAAGLLCAQVLDLDPRQALTLRPALLSLDATAGTLQAALTTPRANPRATPGKRPTHARYRQ